MLAFTRSLVPTLTMLPPVIACACGLGSGGSPVMIRPLMSTRSARAAGVPRCAGTSAIPHQRITALASRNGLVILILAYLVKDDRGNRTPVGPRDNLDHQT